MIVTTAQLFKHAYRKYAVGAYNINNLEQTIGLFRGTSGRFTGYSVAEETSSPGSGRLLSSAVDADGAAIIVALPVILVYFAFQRSFVRGMTSGALKG